MNTKESARITIPGGTLGVPEVEALLLQLAQWRQQQQPAVTDQPDQAMEQALWEDDPSFATSLRAEPFFTLGIKHSGYGWLYFRLPRDKAAVLAAQMHKAAGEATAPNLLLDGLNGDAAH